MSNLAIKVENVSKAYTIWRDPAARLKHPFLNLAGELFPVLRPRIDQKMQGLCTEFYALRDVSFEVRKGESVGIIGRNGSGKSTLLKIIAGTLQPTEGSVTVNGRVAALLELGSGFNPEFTGRENVYLNCSILGLTKEETDTRFDSIVEFADIGDFLEQPVKTYSSGMTMRLAFAVIAHVDADVLIVDEALAVGDAVFVQKCMRFIRAFQEHGTLLFVSHDAASIQNLCRTGIWLSAGLMQQIGAAKDVSESYLQYTLQQIYGEKTQLKNVRESSESPDRVEIEPADDGAYFLNYESHIKFKDNLQASNGWKTGVAEINKVTLTRIEGEATEAFEGGEKVSLIIQAKAFECLNSPILGFLFKDRLGQDLFGENTLPYTAITPTSVNPGQNFEAEFIFRLPMLPNGQYSLNAALANGDLYNHVQHHWLHDALIITVTSSKVRWGLVGIEFEKIKLQKKSI